MTIWLNHACVGAPRTNDLHAAGLRLKQAMNQALSWSARQVGVTSADLVLTNGSTESVDLVLRIPRVPVPRAILVSDHAHPTVWGAARRAAAYLSRMTGEDVQALPFHLPAHKSGTPSNIALAIVERAIRAARGLPTYLILEHVTSLGLRLPVYEVGCELERAQRNIHLVIDGAQAVGVWQLAELHAANYVGCFHKYVGAPIETGFAVVEGLEPDFLPHTHASRCCRLLNEEGEHLPTLDHEKWIGCAEAIDSLPSPGSIVERLMELRQILVGSEIPLHPAIPVDSESPFASHIVSFDTGASNCAERIAKRLAESGWYVGAKGRYIRVSAHHSMTSEEIESFVPLLRRAFIEAC